MSGLTERLNQSALNLESIDSIESAMAKQFEDQKKEVLTLAALIEQRGLRELCRTAKED